MKHIKHTTFYSIIVLGILVFGGFVLAQDRGWFGLERVDKPAQVSVNANQGEDKVDTSDWLTYKDPKGRYELKYPPIFHDLEPLGYYTSEASHSFGLKAIPSPQETTLEDLALQEVTLTIDITDSSYSPMTNIEDIKQTNNWFELGSLKDLTGAEYSYVAYGDVKYATEDGYSFGAFRVLPGNQVLNIHMFAFQKDKLLKYRGTFEQIVRNLVAAS